MYVIPFSLKSNTRAEKGKKENKEGKVDAVIKQKRKTAIRIQSSLTSLSNKEDYPNEGSLTFTVLDFIIVVVVRPVKVV